MRRCSSFRSKGLLILTFVVAWISDDPLPVEFSSSLDSFSDSLLYLVTVTTVAVIPLLRSGEFSGSGAGFFLGLVVLLLTGDSFFGLGRLTGEDKDARVSWCACWHCLCVLLLLLRSFLVSTFFSEPVPFPLPLLLGINHLGVIY